MFDKRTIFPLILTVLGTLILFGQNVTNLFRLHQETLITIVGSFVSIITILILIYKKYKNKIYIFFKNFEIKNNIIKLSVNDSDTCLFSILKLEVKVQDQKNPVYVMKNFHNLLTSIEKNSDSTTKAYIITSLYPVKGTYLVVCTNSEPNGRSEIDEKRHIDTVYRLKVILESIEPDIRLNPISSTKYNILLSPNVPATLVSPFLTATGIRPPFTRAFEVSGGDIELGRTIDNQTVGISLNDVERHILIVGSTGSGKTNTAAVIAEGAKEKGIKVLILDWHGEYTKLIQGAKVYSKEGLPRIDPLGSNKIEETVELLGDALDLTEPQRFLAYVVLQRLVAMRQFDLTSFLTALKEIDDDSYWIRDVKYALMRKLIFTLVGDGQKLFSREDSVNAYNVVERLFDSNDDLVVIDLSVIDSDVLKRLYAMLLLLYVSQYLKKNPNSYRILVVLDEAQNYFINKNNIIIDRIIREWRKFGLFISLVTQSPSSISEEVLKNANTKIIHTIKSNIDKKIIVDSTALDKDLADYLDKLDVGECICTCPSKKAQILIKIKKKSEY